MTLEQAKQLVLENQYLVGTKYKNMEISELVILNEDAGAAEVGRAAQMILQHGEHWADTQLKSYKVFVIYDIDYWANSSALQYNYLDALLIHIKNQIK